jgi:hypothetical protein
MKIDWQPAEPPFGAVAVAGQGVVGERLAARAGHEPPWTIVRFADWTVVVGDELPWVDGVTYLGVLPGTSAVLVPVHRRPCLHPELVVKAVRLVCADAGAGGALRVALIPESPNDGAGRVAVLLLGPDGDP